MTSEIYFQLCKACRVCIFEGTLCLSQQFGKKPSILPIHFSNYLHLISTTPLTLETDILHDYTHSVYKMFLYGVTDLHCAIQKSKNCTSWQRSRNRDWLD